MTKLIIADEVYKRYPALRIGIVIATDIQVRESDPDLVQLKRLVEERVKAQGFTVSSLTKHPFIASWRWVYKSFGADPRRYRPSAEAIVRRVMRGEAIPRINTAVDAYLVVECAHLLPIGGYDLQPVVGDISLRFSPGGERFVPLGKTEPEFTDQGEVVYSDDKRVLTRQWNHRDCDETKITTATKELALFVEAAETVVPTESLGLATGELAETLQSYCGGKVHSFIATARDGLVYELT